MGNGQRQRVPRGVGGQAAAIERIERGQVDLTVGLKGLADGQHKIEVAHTQLAEVVRQNLAGQRQTNQALERVLAEHKQLMLDLHEDTELRLRKLESDQELKRRMGCEAEMTALGQVRNRLNVLIGVLAGLGVLGGGALSVLKALGVM